VRLAWKEIPFDRDDGATPFCLAAKNGDVDLMRVLVAHGADPLLTTVQG
jgi:ankyrin repeat protein